MLKRWLKGATGAGHSATRPNKCVQPAKASGQIAQTTAPKCAKKYGKNDVVILARV
jgi:hypothetical protein